MNKATRIMIQCILDPDADPTDFVGVGTLPVMRPMHERVQTYFPNTHGVPYLESGLAGRTCECGCGFVAPMDDQDPILGD